MASLLTRKLSIEEFLDEFIGDRFNLDGYDRPGIQGRP